jgi:putative redox protein
MPLLTATLTDPDFGLTIVDNSDNRMQIDIPAGQGGNGNGMRPMQTVLAALCGCSAVDIISILKKQRQSLTGLVIKVDGEREKEKTPSLWKTVNLVFELTGDIEDQKAWKAVELSVEKYCSVAETLRRAGTRIKFKIFVNCEEIK